MQLVENPAGIVIKVKLVGSAGDKRPAYTPNDIIAMRAGTGKMIHLLDESSPQNISYKGQEYYYPGNALCGAGRPSKTYPYGSSRSIGAGGALDYGSPIERNYISKGGKPLPITITCYRCLKIHALNKGPVFERDFAPTTEGHTLKHDMLPGGREGFYGEGEYGEEGRDLWAAEKRSPGLVAKEIRKAAQDPEYWGPEREFFRVGAPYARTQPETIEGYKAFERKYGYEDPTDPTGTTPKTEILSKGSRKPKPNPALKVGDRIAEGSRKGTVKSFHSKGTVDVKFDDMDYVIRRQLPMVKRLNPSMHPFLSALHESDLHLALVGGKLGWRMKFTPSCSVEFTFSEPPKGRRTIVLSTIQVTPDSACWNKGYGSKAMQKIVSIADKTRTEIKLFASPMRTSQLNRKKLKEWYKKFGFKELDHDIMIRSPTTKARKNPELLKKEASMVEKLNPSERVQGILYENYNPFTAQFTAQVQGIYETEVRKALKKKSTAKFKNARGVRLDAKLSPTRVRSLLSKAFAIATSVGQKQGYLRKGTNKPTAKGRKRAQEREKDKKHLWGNILDYETTLYLSRKKKEPRILKKGMRFYIMPFGDYALSLSAAIKRIQDRGGKESKTANPRRRRNAKAKPSPLYTDAAAYKSKFRVVVGDPIEIRVDMGEHKQVLFGHYESFLVIGPTNMFRALRGDLYGLKKADWSSSNLAMREKTQTQDTGRSAEEIALTEMTKDLAPTTARVNLLKYWGLHGVNPHATLRREGAKYVPPTREVSLKQLVDAVMRGAIRSVDSLQELFVMLNEFLMHKVLVLPKYPATHAIVKARKKVVKDKEEAQNKLQAEINKLTGSRKPKDKRTLAARKHTLQKMKAEQEAFTDEMVRARQGKSPTFQYFLPPGAIRAAKSLGVLRQSAVPASTVRRKKGETGLEGDPQPVSLFNPMLTFKIPQGILYTMSEVKGLTLFNQKIAVPIETVYAQERIKYKMTSDEDGYMPVLPKQFRIDKKPELAQKNLAEIYNLAYNKYKADNRGKKDLLGELHRGEISIPPKYFTSLTLIMWVQVAKFLLRAERMKYQAQVGGIQQQSLVAYNVMLYAQTRGLPLPGQKERIDAWQSKKLAQTKKLAQKGKKTKEKSTPPTSEKTIFPGRRKKHTSSSTPKEEPKSSEEGIATPFRRRGKKK
jgi:hypothetical protein